MEKVFPYYYLKIKSYAIKYSVYINDVPVLMNWDSVGVESSELINKWLYNGANHIEIYINWLDQLSYSPKTAKAQMSLFQCDANSNIPKPLNTYWEFNWPVNEGEIYPYKKKFQFNLTSVPELSLWKDAVALQELLPAHKKDIYNLLLRLQYLLNEKNIDMVYDLMKYRYKEESQSEGKEPARIQSAVKEQLDWLFSQKMDLQPIVYDNLNFNLVGYGKMVHVTDQKGCPPVIFVDSETGERCAIPIFVSIIDNDWVITR